MKSMYPKQKSYIPRFALLLHVLDCFFTDKDTNVLLISKDSILKAEKLSNYFINMSKKIKVNSNEIKDMRDVVLDNKNKTTKEKFEIMYKQNPNINKNEAAEMLGVSRQMIYKYIKEFVN